MANPEVGLLTLTSYRKIAISQVIALRGVTVLAVLPETATSMLSKSSQNIRTLLSLNPHHIAV
jgi:hypothetical protein